MTRACGGAWIPSWIPRGPGFSGPGGLRDPRGVRVCRAHRLSGVSGVSGIIPSSSSRARRRDGVRRPPGARRRVAPRAPRPRGDGDARAAPPWRLSGRRQWTRAPILRRDESIFRETNGREDRLRGTGFGSDRDRVARRTVHRPRVGRDDDGAPETLVAVAVGSGPGVAVSHDCWIESLRDVVAETAAPTFAARAAADAPRWALDERTRGADRLPFRTVFSSDDELDSSDREDSDEDSDPYAIRHRSRRVRRGGFVGGAARLPADAASARVFSSPATVVATLLGGGAVAAGSANGGFAVWRPDTGVVTRAAAGGGARAARATTTPSRSPRTAPRSPRSVSSPNPPKARPPATTHPAPGSWSGVPAAAASPRGTPPRARACSPRPGRTPAWSLSREPRGSPRLDPLLPGPPRARRRVPRSRSPRPPPRTTGPSVYGTFARDRGRRRRRSRATREGSRR